MAWDPYPLARPLLRLLPPETAHALTLWGLRGGLAPAAPAADDPALRTTLWGLGFSNPVGLAAGFDKDAEAPDAALALGFGFVEIGSVTPRPQPGNPRPRLFRLAEDRAVINRMGFNSAGAEAVAARLAARARGRGGGIVGVNLGKNRDATDAAADYAAGVRRLGAFADYLVVNVSSPNTPGLRALQGGAALGRLLDAVRAARDALDRPPPLLVKIAPDLEAADRADIAAAIRAGAADGLIVGNTTVTRPDGLRSRHRDEPGGLSGRPLFALSTEVLADMYRRTEGSVPLIGTGGIASGADAYAKIRAGASLVQLYSALVYQGPALIGRIKADLVRRARADGFATVAEAVGADHR